MAIRELALTLVLCAVMLVTAMVADAQSRKPEPKRKAEPKPWYWEAERELRKAMEADGLGRAIVIQAPVFPHSTSGSISRLSLQPPVEWAHGELGGDYFGPVRTKVVATWIPNGDSVGRLVIEGPFNRQLCRLEGDVAADRRSVTGSGVCDGQRVAFRACIDRSPDPTESQCK